MTRADRILDHVMVEPGPPADAHGANVAARERLEAEPVSLPD